MKKYRVALSLVDVVLSTVVVVLAYQNYKQSREAA